jgi:hypothetical protein
MIKKKPSNKEKDITYKGTKIRVGENKGKC